MLWVDLIVNYEFRCHFQGHIGHQVVNNCIRSMIIGSKNILSIRKIQISEHLKIQDGGHFFQIGSQFCTFGHNFA